MGKAVLAKSGFGGALAALLGLGACAASTSLPGPAAQLTRLDLPAGPLEPAAYARVSDPYQPVTVYVGGQKLACGAGDGQDGARVLAAADPAANVVFLARQCQPDGAAMPPEAVAAMNRVIDRVVARWPGHLVNMVGYGCGDGLVVRMAAARGDVASIRTVAGRLDAATRRELAAMRIPQIHFRLGDDPAGKSAAGACARQVMLPAGGGGPGWAQRWPELLELVPACS